jgi:hypothetical protein
MASNYNSAQAFKVARHFEFKNGVNVESIVDNKTLTYKSSMIQILDVDSNRDVILPAERSGAIFIIKNQDTVYAITIKDPAGATIVTLTATQGCIVASDGSSWAQAIKA